MSDRTVSVWSVENWLKLFWRNEARCIPVSRVTEQRRRTSFESQLLLDRSGGLIGWPSLDSLLVGVVLPDLRPGPGLMLRPPLATSALSRSVIAWSPDCTGGFLPRFGNVVRRRDSRLGSASMGSARSTLILNSGCRRGMIALITSSMQRSIPCRKSLNVRAASDRASSRCGIVRSEALMSWTAEEDVMSACWIARTPFIIDW